MEALPFLPFLTIPLKQAPDDFTPNIISELRVSLARSGRNPDDYHAQLCIFERHRKDVLSLLASHSPHSVVEKAELELVDQFAAQMHSINKRFGDLRFEGNAWRNADSKGKKVHDESCWFEVATNLWNVAALTSELALHQIGLSMADFDQADELIKEACSMLQRAAGILEFIRMRTVTPPSPDLTSDNIRVMQLLMLQQAQEVIVTKSLRDAKKASTVAKLAWQCGAYCEELVQACQANDFAKSDQKEIVTVARLKADFFKSLAYFSLGSAARDNKGFGEAVAYFRLAKTCFDQAEKAAGNYDVSCAGAFLYARDVVEGSLASAEKDNEFIYHELVRETVPDPEEHNLVKATEWEPQVDADNELFKSLVPDDALIAASNYTEKTDQLWRDMTGEIEAKNVELKKCKEGLEAAGISTDDDVISRDTLPEELISSIARSDETKDLIGQMTRAIDELQVKEQSLETHLESTLKMMATDGESTARCSEKVKEQLADPGWAALTRRIHEINKAFGDSKPPTEMIVSAAKVSIQNMHVLTKGMEHVKSTLPERKELSEEDQEAVALVTKLVSKIAEMVNQRSNLADQLRAALATDDITGKLAGEAVSAHEAIYEKELTKHAATVGYLRKNLAAQEQILAVLDEARLNNAHFYKRQREENQLYDDKINQLVLAADSSKSIGDKLKRGCNFLANLSVELTKIAQVLESALAARDKIRVKFAPPPPERASKPKPKQQQPGLTDEMMKELQEMGMADDPEFVQFLINSGGAVKEQSPLPTHLPGVRSPKIGPNRPMRTPLQMPPRQPMPPQQLQKVPRPPMTNQIMPRPQHMGGYAPRAQYRPPVTPTSKIAAPQVTSQPVTPPVVVNGQLEEEFKRQQATLEQERLKLKGQQERMLSQRAHEEQARLAQQQQFQQQQNQMMEQLALERIKLEQQQSQFEQQRFMQQKQYEEQQAALKQQHSARQQQQRLPVQSQVHMHQQRQPIPRYSAISSVNQIPPQRQQLPLIHHHQQQQPRLPNQQLNTQPSPAQNQPKMTTTIQQPTHNGYAQMFTNVRPINNQSSTHDWLAQYRKQQPPSKPQPVQHQQIQPRAPVYTQIQTVRPPASTIRPKPISVPLQPPPQSTNLPAPLQPMTSTCGNEGAVKPVEASKPKPTPKVSNFDLLSSLCDQSVVTAADAAFPSIIEKSTKTITNDDLLSTLATMKASTTPMTTLKINPSSLVALAQMPLYDGVSGVPNSMLQNTTAAAKMSLTKNRQQMILPYDANRVLLPSYRPNDYINCSRIATSSSALPTALVGEVPLISDDLWSMVWAEKLEMLTVVVSREEEANHGLLDFIISNKIEQVDGNLNVTCKLSHTHDDLTVYQIQLERNREHRCLSLFIITNYSLHAEPNELSMFCWVKQLHQRFLLQKSNRIPPLFMSNSGGPRLGALLFGLIASIELLSPDFDVVRQMSAIYTHMLAQRQFFLSSRHTGACVRAIQHFNNAG